MYVFALRSELHAVSSLVILSPSDNLVSASQEIFVFLCKNGRKSSEASEHGTLGHCCCSRDVVNWTLDWGRLKIPWNCLFCHRACTEVFTEFETVHRTHISMPIAFQESESVIYFVYTTSPLHNKNMFFIFNLSFNDLGRILFKSLLGDCDTWDEDSRLTQDTEKREVLETRISGAPSAPSF